MLSTIYAVIVIVGAIASYYNFPWERPPIVCTMTSGHEQSAIDAPVDSISAPKE